MGGGLMQLVAYGAQDVYLTGNPQITFFKVVYRRHTNFAIEAIAQTFNGQADFGKCASCTISRNGDLMTRCYLQATLPKLESKTQEKAIAAGTDPVVPGCTAIYPCLLGVDGVVITLDLLKVVPDVLCGETLLQPADACAQNAIRSAASRGHARWVNSVGYAMIDVISVEIGGQRIDRHDGRWMQIWHELAHQDEKQYGHDRMVGNMPELTDPVSLLGQGVSTPYPLLTKGSDCSDQTNLNEAGDGVNVPGAAVATADDFVIEPYRLYVPLSFWFCCNPGLALPLIALQYHEVKINVVFNPIRNVLRGCVTGDCCRTLCDVKLWVDYIYLDTEERRRFAQVSHEYVINQVQFTGSESVTSNNARISLNMNHPVKELVWVAEPDIDDFAVQSTGLTEVNWRIASQVSGDTYTGLSNVFNFSNDPTGANNHVHCNPTDEATLYLNGHERVATKHGDYYNTVVPWESHTRTPSCGVNVMSFALKPEEHQPSGTCNFSRIDKAVLSLSLLNFHNGTKTNASNAQYNVSVYAINYNVLRIMSGMGGLAYSN